jgi:general stress protein 26
MADIDHQPKANLQGAQAQAKIHELGKGMRSCMFGTNTDNFPPDIRPMALQAIEPDGSVWLLSSSESDKNAAIARDPKVVMTFQNDDKSTYMSLAGRAAIHTDRETIDKYWTAFANNWFDGKDDPRVTVISLTPIEGKYWETQSGKVVAMTKMILGAMTGGAISDDGGVEGSLRVQ